MVRKKARLIFVKEIIFVQVVVNMFEYNAFLEFANVT